MRLTKEPNAYREPKRKNGEAGFAYYYYFVDLVGELINVKRIERSVYHNAPHRIFFNAKLESGGIPEHPVTTVTNPDITRHISGSIKIYNGRRRDLLHGLRAATFGTISEEGAEETDIELIPVDIMSDAPDSDHGCSFYHNG